MSDQEITDQPLLGANAQSGRSTRPYKVAGLTMLVSVLIVGQALTIYFVFSQKNDIKSLREQSNNLESDLTKSRADAMPIRMPIRLPMSANFLDVSLDTEDSSKDAGQAVPKQATVCQLEAAGVKPVPLPGFRPACDERGLYRAQQCFMEQCWCVTPADGQQLPGSLSRGPARCSTSVLKGNPSKLMALPVDA